MAYGASYGLEVVEFSDGAYFYDRRAGKLLFGGINGLVVVSGGESLHRGYMPPVRFRDVTIDGTDHSISKLMRKGKLVLTHRQGAFGLSIVATIRTCITSRGSTASGMTTAITTGCFSPTFRPAIIRSTSATGTI